MPACPVPIDTEGSLDLYIYCNPSRTLMFLYSIEPNPALNGFKFITSPITIDHKVYNRIESVSKDYPDSVYLYNSFFRLESDPCCQWSIGIGSSMLQCSLPKKASEYHVIDAQCDRNAWSYVGLFRTEGYGNFSASISLMAILFQSNGHKIKLECGTTISMGDPTTIVVRYYYYIVESDQSTSITIPDDNTVQQDGVSVIVLPGGQWPNYQRYNETLGFRVDKTGEYVECNYTIVRTDTNYIPMEGVSPAYGKGTTIGNPQAFGSGTYYCQITVYLP